MSYHSTRIHMTCKMPQTLRPIDVNLTHKVTAGFFTFIHKKVVAENTSAESETVKPQKRLCCFEL